PEGGHVLGSTSTPLVEGHDLVMFDLDGVVYVSGAAVPGVPEDITRVRDSGCHVAFVTNNASRTPEAVVQRLEKVGVAAEVGDVVTSAQAAARLLAERYGTGAQVLLLGGEGLRGALVAEGLVPVDEGGADAVALVSGYGPDVQWRDIMRAAVRVRDGLPYVATNADMTIPTSYGLAPGHGVLVSTIARFAEVDPVVAGKPERPLMDETVRRVGGDRPLMVGDRLDTDIEGAHAIGIPSLLVLTGVTWLDDLVAAPPGLRPTYIASGTSGLFIAHSAPEAHGADWSLGGWTARVSGGRLVV
ncbi:MAG: HAD-IIA family hydrolase, partial [Nocardioides sp.]|nr:HAD-IIA family hydrolase [Nocardioides sp.]